MFASQFCSLNLGPAFIKFFQIIELLGKLYFTPVVYSALLSFFLENIFSLSDIITLPPDILVASVPTDYNGYFGKLTESAQPRHILRSMPVFAPLHLVLTFICLVLSSISRQLKTTKIINQQKYKTKKKRNNSTKTNGTQTPNKSKINRLKTARWVSESMRAFVLEMNLVDFAFYGSYTLTGSLDRAELRSWQVLFSKMIALILLSDCILNLCRICHLSLFNVLAGETQVGARAVKESTMDGIKLDYKNCKQARLSNFLYQCMLVIFQVIVVGFQNNPTLCLVAMIFFSILALGQFLYTTIKNNPWKDILTTLQKGIFLLCVMVFVTVVSLMKIDVKNQKLTISLILLTLLCILSQLVALLYSLLLTVVSCFVTKKNKPTRITSQKTSIDDNELGLTSRKTTAMLPDLDLTPPKMTKSQLKHTLTGSSTIIKSSSIKMTSLVKNTNFTRISSRSMRSLIQNNIDKRDKLKMKMNGRK